MFIQGLWSVPRCLCCSLATSDHERRKPGPECMWRISDFQRQKQTWFQVVCVSEDALSFSDWRGGQLVCPIKKRNRVPRHAQTRTYTRTERSVLCTAIGSMIQRIQRSGSPMARWLDLLTDLYDRDRHNICSCVCPLLDLTLASSRW